VFIERITLHRLKLPLKVPYRLSLAEIHHFDTLLVDMQDDQGQVGLGEATLLTGYTDETVEQCWILASRLAGEIVNQPLDAAKSIIMRSGQVAPFTATALVTAIEMLEQSPHLRTEQSVAVPLLALIHGQEVNALTPEIDALIADGYTTLKLKVGFDVDADLARVQMIQRLTAGRARIRLDANQGYDRADACRFASALDPDGIELLEQTCAAGDWDAAQSVAKVSTVPLMLDESIYDITDIDKAADLGVASYIKFKLMKAGGLARLANILAHIRDRDMEPVLGNGVACDVGCWMEACMVPGHITNAGEMNGFLKTSDSLLRKPLVVEGNAIKLESNFRPALNEEMVARYSEATKRFP
jgi:L-alanine-DL-glutamate epimerase-like enolase superfamily enzyme